MSDNNKYSDLELALATLIIDITHAYDMDVVTKGPYTDDPITMEAMIGLKDTARSIGVATHVCGTDAERALSLFRTIQAMGKEGGINGRHGA